jgi:hypothetical protein
MPVLAVCAQGLIASKRELCAIKFVWLLYLTLILVRKTQSNPTPTTILSLMRNTAGKTEYRTVNLKNK